MHEDMVLMVTTDTSRVFYDGKGNRIDQNVLLPG